MVKRAAPGEEDWLLLQTGETLSATVELAQARDLTRPGDYRLQLRSGISYRVEGEPEPRHLDQAACGRMSFTLSRDAEKGPRFN